MAVYVVLLAIWFGVAKLIFYVIPTQLDEFAWWATFGGALFLIGLFTLFERGERKAHKANKFSMGFVLHPKKGWIEHTKFAWRPVIKSLRRSTVYFEQTGVYKEGKHEIFISIVLTPKQVREIVSRTKAAIPRVAVSVWVNDLAKYMLGEALDHGRPTSQPYDEGLWYLKDIKVTSDSGQFLPDRRIEEKWSIEFKNEPQWARATC